MTMPDIHSFILLGQSNMAGRGDFNQVPDIKHERILMMRNGRWQPMTEPVNPDRGVFGSWHSGISLAPSFALDYVTHFPDRKIGLVPCADGGTNLYHDWQPGGLLFDNAVFQTKQAKRTSIIDGILWHQGESDTHSPETIADYPRNLDTVISAFLRATDLQDCPIVMGELGYFLADTVKWGEHIREGHKTINSILRNYADTHKNVALATAEDLTAKDDEIHFNSPSLRAFGHRYFKAYLTLL